MKQISTKDGALILLSVAFVVIAGLLLYAMDTVNLFLNI